MKLGNGICLLISGSVLILDVLKPGYSQFANPFEVVSPAMQTVTRAVKRTEPAIKLITVAEFSVGTRNQDCKKSAPPRAYLGFNAENWKAFKSKGNKQSLTDVVRVLGGAFCEVQTTKQSRTLRWLPTFTQKKLDVTFDKEGNVKNAVLN